MASLGERGGHCCSRPAAGAAVSRLWGQPKDQRASQASEEGQGSLVDIIWAG